MLGGVLRRGLGAFANIRPVTEQIVRKAFELAAVRGGVPADGVRRVTCVEKNHMLRSHALFRQIFTEVAAGHPDIEADFL